MQPLLSAKMTILAGVFKEVANATHDACSVIVFLLLKGGIKMKGANWRTLIMKGAHGKLLQVELCGTQHDLVLT